MWRSALGVLASVLSGVALTTLLHACGDKTVTQPTNEAPQTTVHASAPRPEERGFAVDFSFEGSDPDGRVAFFEWRLSSESLDEREWTRTEERELTLFFPEDPGDFGPESAGSSHAFWVRAVDERGLADPTAAAVDFTPLTLSPEIVISPPPPPSISCRPSGQVVTFHWAAIDADSKSGAPAFIRYILIPAQQINGSCLTQSIFESGNWINSQDPNWSSWIAYDPLAEDSHPSRGVTFPRQDIGESLLFAVQARDIDGATSRTFGWIQQVVHFEVSANRFPILSVDETAFGREFFVGLGGVKFYDINPGQNLDFSWSASAAEYFGEIDGYRYGWDLQDAADPNDPNWSVEWGDWQSAPTQNFDQGMHRFVIQTRDSSGTITRVSYELTVLPGD